MSVAYNTAVSRPRHSPAKFFAPARIGVCGAQQSYSDAAAQNYALRFLRQLPRNYRFLISAEAVLRELLGKNIDFGVFPISNTYAGEVPEAVAAMTRFEFERNFTVAHEFPMVIDHSVITRTDMTPGDVQLFVSHPHALAQCSRYLHRHWPNVEIKEYPDTALAVEHLATGKLPVTTAVIASSRAAIAHGLQILAGNVQDAGQGNLTTFRVACRRD